MYILSLKENIHYSVLLHYFFCLPHKYINIIVKPGIQRGEGSTPYNLQYCGPGLISSDKYVLGVTFQKSKKSN